MIRIRTLGGLSASREERPAAGVAIQPRRLALLGLLANAGDRGVTRDRVVSIFWPDADEVAARRALSQALHALRAELGDDLLIGVQELRLNPEVTTTDVGEFESAIAERAWERAAEAYGGPFLHGFRLAGAPEFDRWMDEERSRLAQRQTEVLERLARSATERGDAQAAVEWWRRRAAMDALNPRVALELMRALANFGERYAALQHARVYEALVEQELGLPPDSEVVRYAEELRSLPATAASGATVNEIREPDPAIETVRLAEATPRLESVPPASQVAPAGRSRKARLLGVATLIVAAVGLAAAIWIRKPPNAVPLLAVGAIADFRGTSGTAPLTDMLATNLARIPGLQVTSTARLLELIERVGPSPDAAAFAVAARRAGATDLMEGGLHAAPNGELLLQLRRVDLATGRVVAAWQVQGKDFFALVDQATSEFAGSLGRRREQLGPGEPSTRSLAAWRLYEEGLRRSVRGDYREAQSLFESALAEDSTFAMAAYHLLRARHSLDIASDSAQLDWLRRLARRTNDRDRLQILGWVAFAEQSPALSALADTLIVRYPAEIESQFLVGFARMARADFSGALPYLHRVITADSLSLGTHAVRCLACEALGHLTYAYVALDSMSRAYQVAHEWTKKDPRSGLAWASLGSVLFGLGRHDEATAARRRAIPYDTYDNVFPAAVKLRAGDFAAADQMARSIASDRDNDEASWDAFWLLAISYRYQARWRELHELIEHRLAAASPADRVGASGRRAKTTQALAYLESGRPADALRILDSLTHSRDLGTTNGLRSRTLTFYYALLAEAGLALGNAGAVARAADSAEAWSRRDGRILEVGIATHARALERLARQDTVGAIRLFEAAMFSPTVGFTRTNLHLARLLLARGQPRKATDLLYSALEGALDGANFYVTHTELREALADGYAALGKTDSARANWSWLSAALAHADAGARPRYATVIAHLASARPHPSNTSSSSRPIPANTP